MKIRIIIAVIAATGLSFTTLKNSHQTCSQVTRIAGTWQSAVALTESEFSSLTSAYSESNNGTNLGGMLEKSELKSFINNIPGSQDFIRLRFYTDPELQKTGLMLRGDNTFFKNTQYMRNSGADGFCPNNCNGQAVSQNTSESISANLYQSLSDAYSAANPSATLGGRIDKAAVLEIINSLPAEATNVAFRFCTDASSGKTSVIFIGGSVGQTGGATLYYRNGGNAEAFCPDNCN